MRPILIILITLLACFSCQREIIEHPDCDKLKTGIIDGNEQAVKTEIEKLTADLHPERDVEDEIGQLSNLQLLVDRINTSCGSINASLECYACLYSYPPQSVILIEFYEGDVLFSEMIRIITPSNDILRFGGLGNE